MAKTLEEINRKIRDGDAVVLTAGEMTDLVRETGAREASRKVDVVTTGTFGPMCSSGAFINLGHSDPPIKISRASLNDVPVCADLAAVDIYLGATAISEAEGISYGGAHVIEDFVSGKWLRLKAAGAGSDCYPRRSMETLVNRETVNEAFLFNPRNAYQNYACATNSSENTLYTYMGTLLPRYGNATYCSAGQLSPLLNDPCYRTTGIGTRIFLGGAPGYVAWHGTQHRPGVERTDKGVPTGPAGTIAVIGDLKQMDPRFLKGASFHRYGVSLFVGIGIPIPILDEEMARYTGVSDEDIFTGVYDYSQQVRSRTPLARVSYAELRSGSLRLKGRKVHTAPISSLRMANSIAGTLKEWIRQGEFLLAAPVEPLPLECVSNTLDERETQEG